MTERRMLTADTQLQSIIKMSENIAASRATVLIVGESGSGKELLARYIHLNSLRSKRNFIAVNCAAVPEGLLESELFGYEKGAFTSANQRKIGKFELAHEGSFLLDEISEMPLSLQAKILRVIQENEIERLGGQGPIKVDVRLIATTNKDLSEMVKQGTFRHDLFYRLNVVPLHVPPLRARPADIELLARHFVEKSCLANDRPAKELSKEAIDKLNTYSWPGNIRELQNVIERSVLLTEGTFLEAKNILINQQVTLVSEEPLKAGMSLREAEYLLIHKTLEFTKRNKSHAARLLGISVRTLRNKLNEYLNAEVS